MKRLLSNLFRPLRSDAPRVPADALSGFSVDGSGATIYGEVATPTRRPSAQPINPGARNIDASVSALKIRLARNQLLSEDAQLLVRRRFAWRGYEVRGISEDPNLRTFIAYRDGQIAGTLSVRVDSLNGLSADRHYKQEIDGLRSSGARLSEFTRLAVDDRDFSAKVMGTLIHTAFMYLHAVCRCDYAVFEVNPRHAGYYERGLFCDRIGSPRMNERVKAPSVLLCMTLQRTAAEAEKFFANPQRRVNSRSSFAYWFPPGEAMDVLARLRALDRI